MTPLIKKEGLDADDLCNFRSISNVSLVSKMLERLVCERINIHLGNIRHTSNSAISISYLFD